MKKIAVLNSKIPFSYDQAEIMSKNLINELGKRGFYTELIQIPFLWYPQNHLYDNMLIWRMLDLAEIHGETIDLVISTKFPSYGVRHPNKVIWMMHQHQSVDAWYFQKSDFEFGKMEYGVELKNRIHKFEELSLSEAEKIFTISENATRMLQEDYGIFSKKMYYPPALNGKYYCSQYGNYVLYVGRLDRLNRVEWIIQAMKECDETVYLYIVGTGPEEENLKRMTEQEMVSDRVKFIGKVSEEKLLELYANARCVYCAQMDGDYSYVTLEAFLSKKPVITCEDCTSVLEFVRDHQNGIVCAQSSKAIGQALQELFGNLSKCKNYGLSGYDFAKEIRWEHVIEKLTEGI